MDRQLVQMLCLLVALALTDGKKWNTTDPVVKFYCEVNCLKHVAIQHYDVSSVTDSSYLWFIIIL